MARRWLPLYVLSASIAGLRVQGARTVFVALGAPLILPSPSDSVDSAGLPCAPSFSDWRPALPASRAAVSATSALIFSVTNDDEGGFTAVEVACNGTKAEVSWLVSIRAAAAPAIELGQLNISVDTALPAALASALASASAAPPCSWIDEGAASREHRCFAVDADGSITAAAIALVTLSPSAPVIRSISAAGGFALAGGAVTSVPARSLVEVRGVVSGAPVPDVSWLVDSLPSQSTRAEGGAAALPLRKLLSQAALQSGRPCNVTLVASNALGTASLTVFIVTADVPLLVRVPGAPLALVLGSGALINVSVLEEAGRSPAVYFSWYWGGPVPAATTRDPSVLFGGDTVRAGVITCVAHSAVGDSAALDVLHLTVTAPPVLTTRPPLLITAVSGASLHIFSAALGAGNTFEWLQPAPGGGDVVLRESSAAVDFYELRALPTRTSSVLLLRAVSMEDSNVGLDLVVSNPSGSAEVAHVRLNVTAPPWGLHCAPLVLSFSAQLTGNPINGAADSRAVFGLAQVRGTPFVDSTACYGTGTSSSPECAAVVALARNATVLGISDGGEAAGCCPWVVNHTSAFSEPLLLRISRSGTSTSDSLGAVLLAPRACPAALTAATCYVEVAIVATAGAPYSVASTSSCRVRSMALPFSAAVALSLTINTSSVAAPIIHVVASMTPFPGWVLFPVLRSGSASTTRTPPIPVVASESPPMQSASQSWSASNSPIPAATNSSTAVELLHPSSDDASDILVYAAVAGFCVGTALAVCADFVTIRGVHVSAWLHVSFLDVLLWLQFGVFIDLVAMPEQPRFTSLVATLLPWASGVVPGPLVAVLAPLQPRRWPDLPPPEFVGLDRFAAHLGTDAAAVPLVVLVSMTAWWVAVYGAVVALMISALHLLSTIALRPMVLRASVHCEWPAARRVCFSIQAFVALLMLPVVIASGIHVCVWRLESSTVAITSAVLAIAAVCVSLLGALVSKRRGASRDPQSKIALVAIEQLVSALIAGVWPPSSYGHFWLQHGISLVALKMLFCLAIASMLLRAPTPLRSFAGVGGLTHSCRLFLEAAILGCLVADTTAVSIADPIDGGGFSARVFPGTVTAVALWCCCASAAMFCGISWTVQRRKVSLHAASFPRCGNSSVHRAVNDVIITECSPPDCRGGAFAAHVLGLDASFFGGRYLLDPVGTLCYWALLLELLRVDSLIAVSEEERTVSQHSSRAVVDVSEPTSEEVLIFPLARGEGAAGVALHPRACLVDPPVEMNIEVRLPTTSVDSRAAPHPTLVAGARVRAVVICPEEPLLPHDAFELAPEESLSHAITARGLVSTVRRNVRHQSALFSSTEAASGSVLTLAVGDLALHATPAKRQEDEPAVRMHFSPVQPRGFESRLARTRRLDLTVTSAPTTVEGIRKASALGVMQTAAPRSGGSSVRATGDGGSEQFTVCNPMLGGSSAASTACGAWTSRVAALRGLEFWRISPTCTATPVTNAMHQSVNRRRHASCNADTRRRQTNDHNEPVLHSVQVLHAARRASESAVTSTLLIKADCELPGAPLAQGPLASPTSHDSPGCAGDGFSMRSMGSAPGPDPDAAAGIGLGGRAPHYAYRRNLVTVEQESSAGTS